jgi:amino acid adenylation domain-containing protein
MSTTFSDSGLSTEEFELLAYLLEEEGVELTVRQTIFPRSRHDDPPLSFAQARLWFLAQLDPASTAYNLSFAIRVTGWLDVAALERSLNAIVQRHEVLRTTFPAVDGQPIQVIAPTLTIELPLIDLRAMPAAEREREIFRRATHEVQQPFDLARGPLIVAKLLKLAADDHVIVLILHHIVFDGWSTGVFLNEIMALYDAFANRQPSPLPTLPIQYADFAIWQREWLQGEGDHAGSPLQAQLAYWRQQLRGGRANRTGLPMLDLPLDRPRPPRQTHSGARAFRAFPLALAESFADLSQREGTTLFMTLLAAFNVLLYRYTGQHDIVVGTPIANRDFVELEQLIGFFVNTVLLRSDLTGTPSFRVLLGRVREMTLEAYAHQNIPFEQVAHELQPERNLSNHGLFQVMFVLQNAPVPSYERADLRMRFLQIESGTAMFDLMLMLTETPTSLNAMIDYNTDLFDGPTMERLLDQYHVLLAGIAADPDQPITQLPLLTEAARRQLLVDWNATATAYPHEQCAHELFATQAARTPDAVAIVYEGSGVGGQGSGVETARRAVCIPEQLTYRELNARANQLAHHLRAQGVGPETLVGLCIARSVELVVGLLGILKAGAAYLPLDPTYPPERLAFMLDDAQVAMVLVVGTKDERRTTNGEVGEPPFVFRLSSSVTAPVIDLSAAAPAITQQPTTNPTSGVTPDNLAYVIYTSGSLGQPKGVAVTHRGLVNYSVAATERFAIQADDRVLQFASISFDTAAEELYPTLTCGATLVLRTDAFLGTAAQVLAACQALALTVLDLPTAYWHQLTAEIASRQLTLPAALRLLIIGGEAALPDALMRWQASAGARLRLLNTYGPTEATVAATAWEAPDQGTLADPHHVPIGRPVANTQAYVLDAAMQPVPLGVAGELYLGGVGLARGYLGRPDATAERFVPNPFAGVSGIGYRVSGGKVPDTRYPIPATRLYKTGDRARYRADGTLEFLGRVDQQVKIRGFRVEPGEIETVLQQHPALRTVAVVARDAAPGDTRLVAYVVEGSGVRGQGSGSEDKQTSRQADKQEPTVTLSPGHLATLSLITELRAFLAERLPEYLVPAAFVLLDALPLTPTGKVDRQALPAPDWSRHAHADSYVAPRTPTEATVAGLAAQVLSVARVGLHDNFFTLGGHSLLIVRLLARIEQQFGQRIALAALFQQPTVAHLAALLRQRGGALTHTPLAGLQPVGTQPPFFCVHPGAGNVLCYVELAHSLGTARPFYGLQAAGLDDDQPPRSTIEEMASAYLAALRAVQPQGPYLLGGWSFGGLVAFEIAQQLRAQGQRVSLLALIDSWAPLPNDAPPSDEVALLAGFAQDLGRMVGKASPLTIDDLRRIAPEQRLTFVLEQARAADVLPDIDEQQIRRALAVFAANTQAMQRYQPQPYSGPVALFRASELGAAEAPDALLGWAAFVTSDIALHAIPGDHYSMIRPPHVQLLAERLSAAIAAA